MQFLVILTIAVLRYVSSEMAYCDFMWGDSKPNDYIDIAIHDFTVLEETYIRKELTSEDNITMTCDISYIDQKMGYEIMPLCSTEHSTKESELLKIMEQILGIYSIACPIQPQIIEYPESSIICEYDFNDENNPAHSLQFEFSRDGEKFIVLLIVVSRYGFDFDDPLE